uniref:Chalcone-flavonone isomerase family protein n=1 Tax=Oryza nivara TaxID=4536 RepID=A0A0E0JAJ8_ORYNI
MAFLGEIGLYDGIVGTSWYRTSSLKRYRGWEGLVQIESRALCEVVLDSIIGEHEVSLAAKQSIAARVSQLLKAESTSDVAPAAAAEPALVSA